VELLIPEVEVVAVEFLVVLHNLAAAALALSLSKYLTT
jgi:hypothetical protein